MFEERMKRRIVSLVIGSAILAGCETTMGSGGIDPAPAAPKEFCLIAKPIIWFSTDNPITIAGVKEHNAKGAALCGWGKSGQTKTG